MSEPVVTVEIAKAAHAFVNDQDWGDAVVDRNYGLWELDLKEGQFEVEDATRKHIDVVSHRTEVESELSSQFAMKFEVPIDFAVRQKLGQAEQDIATGRINVEDVDRLMGDVQRLQLLFVQQDDKRLPGFPEVSWQSVKVVAAPHQHLRELRQFTGIVRVVFRADLYWKPVG